MIHWYAESRGRGVAAVRYGAILLDRGDLVVAEDPFPSADQHPWFGHVLKGHPARRRHRLPRR